MLLLLLSLVPTAACYAVFAWWLPADRELYRDYRAAEPCSAGALEQGQTDCLSAWHLTVEKTVNKTAGKRSVYEATLTDEGSRRRTVSFGDAGPLLERLRPGDRVEATAWRGYIRTLSKDDVRQDTADAPRDELQMNAAIGVLAGLSGAQLFLFGAMRLSKPHNYQPFTWKPYGKALLFITLGACFGVGLPAVWMGVPWWTVPAVSVPVVVGAAWALRSHLSRTAACAEHSASGDSRPDRPQPTAPTGH
ncbi:hypothetical protein [Streptomyces sp. NPDC054842]